MRMPNEASGKVRTALGLRLARRQPRSRSSRNGAVIAWKQWILEIDFHSWSRRRCAGSIRDECEIRFHYREGNQGRMKLDIKEGGPFPNEPPARRANRRLNGMAETA